MVRWGGMTVARSGFTWRGVARRRTVAWCGVVRHGVAWRGVACRAVTRRGVDVTRGRWDIGARRWAYVPCRGAEWRGMQGRRGEAVAVAQCAVEVA